VACQIVTIGAAF